MSHKSSDRHSPLLRLTKGENRPGLNMSFRRKKQRVNTPRNKKHTERLTVQCWLLLIVNALFVTANALSGTFVGVFFMEAAQRLVDHRLVLARNPYHHGDHVLHRGQVGKRAQQNEQPEAGGGGVCRVLYSGAVAWQQCCELCAPARRHPGDCFGFFLGRVQRCLF